MYRYLLLFIFFASLRFQSAVAQEDNRLQGFGVEANVLAGRIVKHTHKFRAPIPPLSSAFDVNFIWQTYGRKEWQQRRKFPQVGVGLTYTNYGDDRIFGHCVGIYPNLQVPLMRRKNYEWTLRLGNGLGYVTRKYQTNSPYDTLNNAIGSHINDFAIIMTDFRIHVDKHWQLQAGANFTHISDADYRQPNLGVNMLGVHMGVQYFPITCKPKLIIKDLPKLRDRWLIELRYGMSLKQARAPKINNPIEPAYIGTAYVSRRWWSKNKIFAGVDFAYHKDVYEFLVNYLVHYGHEKAHAWDGALFAGNEFLVGRVGLMAQVGIYYHQTYLKFDPFYEKMGVNFYLMKNERGPIKEVFLSAMLLTHEITAEYAEFGIGAGF